MGPVAGPQGPAIVAGKLSGLNKGPFDHIVA